MNSGYYLLALGLSVLVAAGQAPGQDLNRQPLSASAGPHSDQSSAPDDDRMIAQVPATGARPGAPGQPAQPALPIPPPPGVISTPGIATAAPLASAEVPGGAPSLGLTNLGSFSRSGIPQMLGDMGPSLLAPRAVSAPGNPVRVPWVRGYKMADNQSPRPQDRVFVAFNLYDDVGGASARGSGASLGDVRVYREFFGLEKTFFDQRASIGFRLPLNTLAVGSPPSLRSTSTSLGDLTIFLKSIVLQDPGTGSLLSLGLAVTPPTGPAAFAGADFAKSVHATAIQPFVGYILARGNLFFQGFSGINAPTDPSVVTMMYNDVGVGYFLFRNENPEGWLSAIVPAFEVHVNTPLNHRATSAVGGLAGTPDVVDLTMGSSFVFRRAVFSFGFVEPVSGPRPFDFELVALLNITFGAPRAPATPFVPFLGP
jgi:hypothetical protein